MLKPNNSGNFFPDSRKEIARFDPIRNSWTKLGELNSARNAHRVIQADNQFIVIGGFGNRTTESCRISGEFSMKCNAREPQLLDFAWYFILKLTS